MSTATPQISAYQQTVEQVLVGLGTDSQQGLSTAEARARLQRYGKNELTT
jgi:Ca2+-transporting ATPase